MASTYSEYMLFSSRGAGTALFSSQIWAHLEVLRKSFQQASMNNSSLYSRPVVFSSHSMPSRICPAT